MKKIVLILCCALAIASISQAAIIADHNSVAAFENIPEVKFQEVRDEFKIFYGRASHGTQLLTGLTMLIEHDPVLYDRPDIGGMAGDLGYYGDLSWVDPTREWLAENPDGNLVMWAWCDGVEDNTEEGINAYLNAMSQLEQEYPEVIFVYMTGHLDGTGPDGNNHIRNNQIREYCSVNNKVLYDFADIESWDPAGNYYPYEDEVCNWCYDWCLNISCETCDSCQHSHCFNCSIKGKAFWWLLAQLTGSSLSASPDLLPEASIELGQNFPNPFNPRTEITIRVKKSGHGNLGIYNVAGEKVTDLFSGFFAAGDHAFTWDASSHSGSPLGSGVYFCRLQLGDEMLERKMTLLK